MQLEQHFKFPSLLPGLLVFHALWLFRVLKWDVSNMFTRRSQQRNGSSDVSQKLPLAPDVKPKLKSPVANGDDSNSKLSSSSSSSSSSSQLQRRTEKIKPQDGNARVEEKTRKTSTSKVNGKLANSEVRTCLNFHKWPQIVVFVLILGDMFLCEVASILKRFECVIKS